MDQLLDLLACQLATTGEFAQYPLAICTRLVDHLAALLLGHLQFRICIRGGVLTAANGFQLGLFTQALGLVGGIAQQTRGAFLRSHFDL